MARTHNLGFPRIGARRQLKFALESYWRGQDSAEQLQQVAAAVRAENRRLQAPLDLQPVGDFSLYDHVLDTSVMLGHVPQRFVGNGFNQLDRYFRMARGRAVEGDAPVAAGEMTKWFNTNYHYIVPEFTAETRFSLNTWSLCAQIDEAHAAGIKAKAVILGPLSYLWVGKAVDGSERLDHLDALIAVYAQLLAELRRKGVDWVQIDEPALTLDLPPTWRQAYQRGYEALHGVGPRSLLTTYFGPLDDNLKWVLDLPVDGFHLDASDGIAQLDTILARLHETQVLSLGVIDGRNVWASDLNALLDVLEPVDAALGERLWLAPSCSLLHVPVDLSAERALDPELLSWLAFAVQKLDELTLLAQALKHGREHVAEPLLINRSAIQSRRDSTRTHNPSVREQIGHIAPDWQQRRSPYAVRAQRQAQRFALPAFPTTTIGSFPQTQDIRAARRDYRAGALDDAQYRQAMQREIAHCLSIQHELGLDVLVHGEAERNDMVEYFGELLDGFAFSRQGWVQSYGSRCVKPPILYGDVQRPAAMTVQWARYAQSLSDKPVKGMLTGPVTLLNWSFVRDDQPRSETCLQIALAIREEVQDLAAAGIHMIQIDEAALREGLPLRQRDWPAYLDWAIAAFRLAANGVDDDIQIHTHMCYSEFNDIIDDIARMDADVITIETSRSHMQLLDAFQDFEYPNAIGPGVYDIHSPNVPDTQSIVELMRKAATRIPPERLWVNPDCGLKTRSWSEVKPALANMVEAARRLRQAA